MSKIKICGFQPFWGSVLFFEVIVPWVVWLKKTDTQIANIGANKYRTPRNERVKVRGTSREPSSHDAKCCRLKRILRGCGRISTSAVHCRWPAISAGAATAARRATYSSRISSDRKSTRLNSSHLGISYAVFCLKKK